MIITKNYKIENFSIMVDISVLVKNNLTLLYLTYNGNPSWSLYLLRYVEVNVFVLGPYCVKRIEILNFIFPFNTLELLNSKNVSVENEI
jgi:hypothetical protein